VPSPRVVLLVLDGFPNRHVTSEIAPTLSALAAGGGRARDGGEAVMASATYPNHATFATGAGPAVHGLYANNVVVDATLRPAETVGPAVPTIFDVLGPAGITTECVVGDHHLVTTMGALAAGAHWPDVGRRPSEGPYDVLGYVADEVTVERIVAATGRGPGFLLAHLNEPDTAGHVFGPDRPRALEVFAATDARVAMIVRSLEPVWDDTVLLVVSDHDMEPVTEAQPVDLVTAAARAGCPAAVVHEGSGAVLVGDAPFEQSWLGAVEGVHGWLEVSPRLIAVTAVPGRFFGAAPVPGLRGVHGGEGSRAQVAIVAGGHRAVAPIAASLAARRPGAADWAVTAAALFGLRLPGADGRDLGGSPLD